MAVKIGDTIVITDTGGLTGSGLTYPVVDGEAGQFMTTDGNGNLSFSSVVIPTPLKVGISSTVVDTGVSEVNISFDGLEYDRYELELIGISTSADAKLRWQFTDASGSVISGSQDYRNSSLDNYNTSDIVNYTATSYTEVNRYVNIDDADTYGGISATYKFERMKQPPAYSSGYRIRWTMLGGYVRNSNQYPVSMNGFGFLDKSLTETSKPTGIKFFSSTGNIDEGRFNLYGLNDPS